MADWKELDPPSFEALRGASCSECGYDFGLHVEQARRVIAETPVRLAELIARGEDPRRAPAPGVWSPSAYVWHLVDAFRLWAERAWGLRHDPAFSLVPFDQDEAARVRGYEQLSTVAGVWALERAAADLLAAFDGADLEAGFEHPEYGSGTLVDALRWMGHEAQHHQLDVRRGLGLVRPDRGS